MKIKEVIVVEGYHDAKTLKQYFDVETIVTNGSAINEECLELIRKTNETKGIIVFVDPDFPGEQIRKKITKVVPNCKHAFIDKDKAISNNKTKVGVEHATKTDLMNSLKNCVTFSKLSSLTWNEFIELQLVGSKLRRQVLCKYLKIGYCNAKTLFKRINMLNLDYQTIIRIYEEIDNG